jgi:predicted nuclease of predicted toxin-antitoxin system
MIIIDESVGGRLFNRLKAHVNDIISIRQDYSSVNDRRVIKIAKDNNGIVITGDKDFGELVFLNEIRSTSIILLRYNNADIPQIVKNILKTLNHYKTHPGHFFTTITAKKIRIQEI